jgi:hypothetical protein
VTVIPARGGLVKHHGQAASILYGWIPKRSEYDLRTRTKIDLRQTALPIPLHPMPVIVLVAADELAGRGILRLPDVQRAAYRTRGRTRTRGRSRYGV